MQTQLVLPVTPCTVQSNTYWGSSLRGQRGYVAHMALRVESRRPRHRSEMLTKAVEDVLLQGKCSWAFEVFEVSGLKTRGTVSMP